MEVFVMGKCFMVFHQQMRRFTSVFGEFVADFVFFFSWENYMGFMDKCETKGPFRTEG